MQQQQGNRSSGGGDVDDLMAQLEAQAARLKTKKSTTERTKKERKHKKKKKHKKKVYEEDAYDGLSEGSSSVDIDELIGQLEAQEGDATADKTSSGTTSTTVPHMLASTGSTTSTVPSIAEPFDHEVSSSSEEFIMEKTLLLSDNSTAATGDGAAALNVNTNNTNNNHGGDVGSPVPAPAPPQKRHVNFTASTNVPPPLPSPPAAPAATAASLFDDVSSLKMDMGDGSGRHQNEANTTPAAAFATSTSGSLTAGSAEFRMIDQLRASQAVMLENMNRMEEQMAMMSSTVSHSVRRGGGGEGKDDEIQALVPMAPHAAIAANRLRDLDEEVVDLRGSIGLEDHEDAKNKDRKKKMKRMTKRSFFDLLGWDGEDSDREFSEFEGGSDIEGASGHSNRSSRNIKNYMRSMFGLQKAAKDDFMDTLPQDSFSLMKVAALQSVAFWTSLTVYLIQVGCYLLLMSNLMENGYPGNVMNIPANVTPAVRVTQFILLSVAVLTQDPIRTGVALIFKGYTPSMDDAFPYLNVFKFYIIVLMRIAEGSLGLIVTSLLIYDSEIVIDLLLNFTAMEFISQLDEIYFGLAAQGFLGNRLKVPAMKVIETKYQVKTVLVDPDNPKAGRQRRGFKLHIILIATWAALMVAWISLMVRQTHGEFLCQSFHVQFEDDFVSSLGAFSGIYDIDPTQVLPFTSSRVRYIDRASGKAIFAYCDRLKAWSFAFAEDGHFPDPCIDWVAHSAESKTFDILSTSDHVWTVRNTQDEIITIDHFHLECMDCQRREDFAGECHGYGICRDADAVCECFDGRTGLNCEFDSPCTELEMDVRFGGFQDEREWSRSFDLFVVDGEPVYAYDRPVYAHQYKLGEYEIVAFTGRRWMATYTEVLLSANLTGVEDPLERSRRLAYYFTDHFHAYWSDFVASFMTQPMDILTEQDGATPVELHWFRAKPKNALHPHEVQYVDESVEPLDSVFLCRLCHNETNICLNNGHCNDDLHCVCPIGSYGSLCQVPPTGNGRCDPEFDVPKYSFDGGDCCESTCISGDVYHCGKDETGFIDLGYFFCIHEEDEWHLNRASFDSLAEETRYAMAVSNDGHILALGEANAAHVIVFDADGSEWVQRGRVLEGPLGSSFGAHVAMSVGLENTVRNYLRVDPVRVIASGRLKKDGFVRVYECLSEGCSQSGSDIHFDGLNAESRTVQDISSDGRIVAFGGFNATKNSSTVSFYHYEESLGDWTHEGIPDLEFIGDSYALKLSGDFDTLAIRSVSIWEAAGIDEFHRKFEATDAKAVFHLNVEKGVWEQVGHTIFHHIDGYGASSNPDDFHILDTRHRLSEFLHGSDPIDISDDGLVMAVGFPFSTTDPGVHVYELDQRVGEWVDRGHTITNNHTDGFKGWSVSLSGDGSVVVIGTGGDETATNTYIWDGLDWNLYGHEIPGGEQSSIALSVDGSVLAVGRETVDVYHRNIKTQCPPDMEWFHLSLTLDAHPEDTRWDLVYNATGEVLLSGGPYVGTPDGFPYSNAYERSTIVVEACVPRGECKVFSIYDKVDPLVDVFKIPDGMLIPSIYDFSVDGVEIAKRRLDQACDHYYFGDNCQECPSDTHALKVLVRSCVPYHWTLTEDSAGQVLVGDNGADFSNDDFSYIRDGTCQHLGLEVHTYWEEACVHVGDLDHDCFHFDLEAHPNWPVVENLPGDIELDHAHRNTEVVLLFDDKQINVDLALVGSLNAGPPSQIHYRYGGACPEGWDTDPPESDYGGYGAEGGAGQDAQNTATHGIGVSHEVPVNEQPTLETASPTTGTPVTASPSTGVPTTASPTNRPTNSPTTPSPTNSPTTPSPTVSSSEFIVDSNTQLLIVYEGDGDGAGEGVGAEGGEEQGDGDFLGTIEKVGNGGNPEDVFPLAVCKGDCDDDDECAEGLKCKQRDSVSDPVSPKCSGEPDPEDAIDYCVPSNEVP